jgi:hypothetical protein
VIGPGNEQPYNNGSLTSQTETLIWRNLISGLEETLDTTDQQTITSESIATFVKQVTGAITYLRQNTNVQCVKGREAVMSYLRDARVELNVASQELKKNGKTRKFFTTIDAARAYLKQALDAW